MGLFDKRSDERKKLDERFTKNPSNDELDEEYKKNWRKHHVIEFKNERIAILHNLPKLRVQFIRAFDDLTKEGYRLVASRQLDMSHNYDTWIGYFYFQKIDFVK